MCQAILGFIAVIAAIVFNHQVADLVGEDGAAGLKVVQKMAADAGLPLEQLGVGGGLAWGGKAGAPPGHVDATSSPSHHKKRKRNKSKGKHKKGGGGGSANHEDDEEGEDDEASPPDASSSDSDDGGWQTSTGGKHGGGGKQGGPSAVQDKGSGVDDGRGSTDEGKGAHDGGGKGGAHHPNPAHSAYYASINLQAKGPELRSQLRRLVARHDVLEYHKVWEALESIDAPSLGGEGCRGKSQVRDLYSGLCWSKRRGRCGKGDLDVGREGACYNREHSWPKSWWGGDFGVAAATDLHHIFLTDAYVNKLRSNLPMGTVGEAEFSSANGAKIGICSGGRRPRGGAGRDKGRVKFFNEDKGFGFVERGGGKGDVFLHADHVRGGERVFAGDLVEFKVVKGGKGDAAREAERVGRCFEPPDDVKGDLARVYFYMSVAYEGEFACCSSFPGVERNRINDWMERVLREWHRDDPVQEGERGRNEAIFELQGNRNPFVDHPHLVQAIADF